MENAALVDNLNKLLATIEIPLVLTNLSALTPALLLTILETILRTRLPLSHSLRKSNLFADKVTIVKLVLGVLESDVLRADVGISAVDPRRLAAGKPDEVVFIGRVFCWLARTTGMLQEDKDESFLSPLSNATLQTTLDLSILDGHTHSSATSAPVGDDSELEETGDQPTERRENVHDVSAVSLPPRCIHELNTASLIPERYLPAQRHSIMEDDGESLCTCTDHSGTVRRSGVISLVDERREVEAFEASMSLRMSITTEKQAWRAAQDHLPHASTKSLPSDPSQTNHRTLQLLTERAELWAELDRIAK